MGSFTQLNYHVVFGTKYRHKTIRADISQRLYEFTGGIARNLGGALTAMGGIEDHVHLLVNLPASKTVSDCIRDLKANSSRWISELPDSKAKFEWQKGYGAFTVSYSQLKVIEKYISNQQNHHREKSFEEEYIELLQKHGITFERKYLFEGEFTG